MSELELLMMRLREHELAVADLKLQIGAIEPADHLRILGSIIDEARLQVYRLEQQGHDYLTITAEMARIRAEVRGEK